MLLCLSLLLSFLQTLVVTKDKLNALSFGIDLQGGIEGLATLGGHTFHFHSLALHKVFVLCIRKGNTLDFLGDVHTVGTQGDNLIGLRINGNVGRERLSVLGCYFDGLAEIARSE